MGGEPQAGGADLAVGGVKGTSQAAQERTAVAERWVMRKAETGEEKPRWAYDFVRIRTRNGRAVRLLTVIDEYTGECLTIRAGRSIRAPDVIETLAGLMLAKGVPEHIRSDNGTEFTARAVREWLARVGAKTLYIKPGSPWENGYVESFNGKLRDELLEVQVLTEQYRRTYNQIRPHSSLEFRLPAPEAIQPSDLVTVMAGLT